MPSYRLPVKEWPSSERPREKLLQLGPEHLSDQELLGILLRTGTEAQDPVSLSQSLLVSFGGLVGLSRAPTGELKAIKGIGDAKVTSVLAALELGRRLLRAEVGTQLQIRSPSDVASLLQIEMGLLQQEQLRVVLLDTKNFVQRHVTVYQGSVNSSQVRTAEVFRDAVRENCPSVIVAHNHPSGDPTPSAEDVRVTRELVNAGRLLDIEVLDHLVIGRSGFVSLRQKKLGFD